MDKKIKEIISDIFYLSFFCSKKICKLKQIINILWKRIGNTIKVTLIVTFIMLFLLWFFEYLIRTKSWIIKYLIAEFILFLVIIIFYITYKIFNIISWTNKCSIEKILFFNTSKEAFLGSFTKYIKNIFTFDNEYKKYLFYQITIDQYINNKYEYYLDSYIFKEHLIWLWIKPKKIYSNNLWKYKETKVWLLINNKSIENDINIFEESHNIKQALITNVSNYKESYIIELKKSNLWILLKLVKYIFKIFIFIAKYIIIGVILVSSYVLITDYDDKTLVKSSMMCIKENDILEKSLECILNEKETVDNLDLSLNFLNNNSYESGTYKDNIKFYITNTILSFSLIIILLLYYLPPIILFSYIISINKNKLIVALDNIKEVKN